MGRSLLVPVVVPKFIPKIIRDFWREGVIAKAVGKMPAAALYFRLVIEHHVRGVTKATGLQRGEDLLDLYRPMLPQQFTPTEPTLTNEYRQLSEIVHSGVGNGAALDSIQGKMLRHFQVLDLFPITVSTPPEA